MDILTLTKPDDLTDQVSTAEKMIKQIELKFRKNPLMDKPTRKDPRKKKNIMIRGEYPEEDRREVCAMYVEQGWLNVIHRNLGYGEELDAFNEGTTGYNGPRTQFVFFKA